MLEMKIGKILEFDYLNWKGEKGHRRVQVNRIYYGSTVYHNTNQWLLEALDLDKQQFRLFAMSDMSNVNETV
jgi:predicted DNA-binding transcriptional regulator YafY